MFHPAFIMIAAAQAGQGTPATPGQTPTTTPAQTPPAAQAPMAVPATTPDQNNTTVLPAIQAAPIIQPFIKQMIVAEPMRIALTPKIDGKIDPEEWDALTAIDTANTYFQW